MYLRHLSSNCLYLAWLFVLSVMLPRHSCGHSALYAYLYLNAQNLKELSENRLIHDLSDKGVNPGMRNGMINDSDSSINDVLTNDKLGIQLRLKHSLDENAINQLAHQGLVS